MIARIPADIETVLNAHAGAHSLFADLPPAHRQDYLDWIEGAGRPETRRRRVQDMIKRLETKNR